jgi:aerobic-type carbon monoxide dehydrogenase small subunit (CoxS/CutS family)
MNLTVNGREHEITSGPLTPLLHVLREELEITSPKAGCQQGGCGTCTVLVDGEPRRSCLTAVATVDGASITTLEGLGEAEALSDVQAAFH